MMLTKIKFLKKMVKFRIRSRAYMEMFMSFMNIQIRNNFQMKRNKNSNLQSRQRLISLQKFGKTLAAQYSTLY